MAYQVASGWLAEPKKNNTKSMAASEHILTAIRSLIR